MSVLEVRPERLRELMQQHRDEGWTLRAIGEKYGYTTNAVHRILRGRFSSRYHSWKPGRVKPSR